MCWYCTWGIPFEAAKIYLDAVDMLNGDTDPLHFSAAHVVWDDYNFTRENICSCINNFDTYKSDYYSDRENRIVLWSLLKLSRLDDSEFDIEPDVDDKDMYENYPPSTLTINVDQVVDKWQKAGRWE